MNTTAQTRDITWQDAQAAGESTVSLLDPAEVCDRCGAHAYVAALFSNGSELTFCGHHARRYRDALAHIAIAVRDETHRISPATHPKPRAETPEPA